MAPVIFRNWTSGFKKMLLAGTFASSLFFSMALAQSAQPQENPAPDPSPSPSPTRKASPYRSAGVANSAQSYYRLRWGVDSFAAKVVESGLMIRFSYRVVDPEKAKVLNDKKAAPFLLDERAHAKLVVPTMEKIGQLRQSSTPEAGKLYWMVFANKEKYVKPGDRVSIVIGEFRVDGLVLR